MNTQNPSDTGQQANRRYLTVWRWHFYFGLLVVPFLTLLAVTGLGMLLFANITGKEGERIHVTPQAQVQPLSAQAEAARQFVNEKSASVVQYIAPRADDMVAVFRVNNDDKATMVAVDPYTAKVVNSMPRGKGWYHTMDEIHGDIMLGTAGDYLLETAASLTILMMITGIYLWWAKQGRLKPMLVPKAGKGRSWWRDLHGAFGTWVSLILLLFCLSGIAWAGIWGGKMVQSWSQFPAGKWGVEPNPVSAVPTHGDVLNDGKTKEAPWILELTPMPVSGTTKGDQPDRRPHGAHRPIQRQNPGRYPFRRLQLLRQIHGGQHRAAHGDAGLVERAGERRVLPGRHLHLRQRLRDVVETPSVRSARAGSPGAENQVAGMVGNGGAAFGCGGIVPDRHHCHRRDLAAGYGFAVADSGVVALV